MNSVVQIMAVKLSGNADSIIEETRNCSLSGQDYGEKLVGRIGVLGLEKVMLTKLTLLDPHLAKG